MVRPRTGDFVYSVGEVATMLEDIRIFKTYGVRGIVVGALTPDGRIDQECMKRFYFPSAPSLSRFSDKCCT